MKKTYGTYLSQAWQSVNGNLPLFAALGLVMGGSLLTCNLFPLVGSVFFSLCMVGYYVVFRKVVNGEDFGFQDLFWSFLDFKRLLQVMTMAFLQSVGVFLATLLLVIPGIWLLVRWSMATAIFPRLTGSQATGWNALSTSSAMVKGRWWWFAGLIWFLALLNIVGALFFGIGLLITIPMSIIIHIAVVDDLINSVTPSGNGTPVLGSELTSSSGAADSFVKVTP